MNTTAKTWHVGLCSVLRCVTSDSIYVVALTYLVLELSRLKWAASLGLCVLTSMCVWFKLHLKSC